MDIQAPRGYPPPGVDIIFPKNKIMSTPGRPHWRVDIQAWGWTSTPGDGYPRLGVDIRKKIMSMPGGGYPRPGVEVHAQEFFITDCTRSFG